jgi:hypothetical protein
VVLGLSLVLVLVPGAGTGAYAGVHVGACFYVGACVVLMLVWVLVLY